MHMKRLLLVLAVAATAGCTHHEPAQLTPLMSAASAGNAAQVRALVGAGADVNAMRGLRLASGGRIEGDTKPTDETALGFAVEAGDLETIRILLDAGARTDVGSDLAYTPWGRLSKHLDRPQAAEILRLLLAPSQGMPRLSANLMLYDAMAAKNEAVAAILLDHVEDPQVAYCFTPLPLDDAHFVSMMALVERRAGPPKGRSLECGLRADTPLKLEYFLKHGADPNAPGPNFRPLTAIAFDVMQGYPLTGERREMVKLLLRYGADPALPDRMEHGNPIEMARKSGNTELLNLLTHH